jgi:hypothetical protein
MGGACCNVFGQGEGMGAGFEGQGIDGGRRGEVTGEKVMEFGRR